LLLVSDMRADTLNAELLALLGAGNTLPQLLPGLPLGHAGAPAGSGKLLGGSISGDINATVRPFMRVRKEALLLRRITGMMTDLTQAMQEECSGLHV
jgi:hypothetical protein